MTHLSLCTGIGALDLGLGVIPDVVSEVMPAASEVLDARLPGVPNIGDWTELDQFDSATDLITGGLPCQTLSQAGKRLGDRDDRYLFDEFTRILRHSDCRPDVVLENVRGFLAKRNEAEFSRFIHAMADLGYVLRWEVVPAAAAGAPHLRHRWFCIASHLPDYLGPSWSAEGDGGQQQLDVEGRGDAAGQAAPRDPDSVVGGRLARVLLGEEGTPQREARDWHLPDGPAPAAAGRGRDPYGHAELAASKHGPVLERWTGVIGRDFPDPLQKGPRGGTQINACFTEWMMGLPEGWVTDVLANRKSLHVLGNAVVPQQARLAIHQMLGLEVTVHDLGTDHLPSPVTSDGRRGPDYAREHRDGSGGDDLVTHLFKVDRGDHRLPTPTSRDYKGANQRNDDSCLHGALTSHA